MSLWEEIPLARWWQGFLSKQSYRSGTRITEIRTSTVNSLFQPGVDARKICVITEHKDEWSLSSTSARKQVHKKESVERFKVTPCSHNLLFGKKLQESEGKMSPVRQPFLFKVYPNSLLQNHYFLDTAVPKLHPTYSDWNNEHLSQKVWRTVPINPQTQPNNRERR